MISIKAYPDVPWIFLYRKPVQVLMSHVNPWKLSDHIPLFLLFNLILATALAVAPCLRSKSKDPPMLVL